VEGLLEQIRTPSPAAPIVLNSVELNGDRFDHAPNPLAAKVFLCTSQRTGSFFLCRAMMHHGIGIPHGYFNNLHITSIGRRLGLAPPGDGLAIGADASFRRAYIQEVLRRRTVNGVFAAKIQWGQYAQLLDNPAGEELLHGGHLIYLYREDLLAQAISVHIAMETGMWGLDGRVTSTVPESPRFFDEQLILDRLKRLADNETNWRLFFARSGITPLMISYEQLVTDTPASMRRIVAAFALRLPKVPDYAEVRLSVPHAPGTPSAADIWDWFVRLQGRAPLS
jgi:LPS sulfotransferase NodH